MSPDSPKQARGATDGSAGEAATATPVFAAPASSEFQETVLGPLGSRRIVLEDFRPMTESLEWRLGRDSWRLRGTSAFLGDGVPFKATSDGNLSVKAAEVLHQALLESAARAPSAEPILVLELGAGLGLFARLFLDAFRDRCDRAGTDFYGRLRYVLVDQSPSTLDRLAREGVFSRHEARVELRCSDVLAPGFDPASLAGRSGNGAASRLDAIFLNYVLDCLPSRVLRRGIGGWGELHLRTSIPGDLDVAGFTGLSLARVLGMARSGSAEDLESLALIQDFLVLEAAYRPVDLARIPFGDLAEREETEHGCVLLNHGAIELLDRALGWLRPGGAIFINDYDDPRFDEGVGAYRHQRFGRSTAIGLNSALIGRHFGGRKDCAWVEPDGPNGPLCSRLLGHGFGGETESLFRKVFGKAAHDWHFSPVQEARNLVEAGRHESARAIYAAALARQPRNWALLLEAADFLAFKVADYSAALALAETGLNLNPLSAELCNTRGDCLYYLGRLDEAHAAFLRALDLHPEDVRSRYNLSFTLRVRGDRGAALRVIAEALALDRKGRYRERLLRQQEEILDDFARRQKVVDACRKDRYVRVADSGSDPRPDAK